MKFQIEERSNFMHVIVREGRLDIFGASELKEKLFSLIKRNRKQSIVLNINNCSFCDASGLSAINSIYRLCEKAFVSLAVTGIQPNIEKLIKICMLDSVWNIVKKVDEVQKE